MTWRKSGTTLSTMSSVLRPRNITSYLRKPLRAALRRFCRTPVRPRRGVGDSDTTPFPLAYMCRAPSIMTHAVARVVPQRSTRATQFFRQDKRQSLTCFDFQDRIPNDVDSATAIKTPKSWDSFGDPVAPLERNLCGHPLAGLFGHEHLKLFCWKNIFSWKIIGNKGVDGSACSFNANMGCFFRHSLRT